MGMIKIKCPTCGAILSVADDPSNVRKSVKCPVCEEKHRFTEFKSVQNKAEESDRTQLGINTKQSDRTELPMQSRPVTLGYLLDETHNRKYTLCAGLNLIGRKTYQTASVATIAIETDDLGFSRQHIYIEAIKGPDGVVRHYAYNANNKNETTINGHPLGAQDKVILHDSDTIRSSSTILVFKVAELSFPQQSDDSDKTQL